MDITKRSVASLALGLAGIVIAGVGLNGLLETGSCSSGGRYATLPDCPDGIEMWMVLLPIGLVVWMAGLILSPAGLVEPGTGQVLWTALFAGGGVALLFKILTQPSLPADAKLGAGIVAALFIPMGLTVGVIGIVQHRRQLRAEASRQTHRARRPTIPDTPAGRMQHLHRLRSMDALTRPEFDRLRADDALLAALLPALRDLSDQRASGALTDAEFHTRKHALLGG
jgi:hypothetical protein